MFELADELRGLHERKRELEAELKEVNAQIKKVNEQLSQEMVDKEVQNFSRNGKLFYLTTQYYPSEIVTKREQFYTALQDRGYGDLIKSVIHPAAFKSFIKEQIENNDDELPDWLNSFVRVFKAAEVRMRKA